MECWLEYDRTRCARPASRNICITLYSAIRLPPVAVGCVSFRGNTAVPAAVSISFPIRPAERYLLTNAGFDGATMNWKSRVNSRIAADAYLSSDRFASALRHLRTSYEYKDACIAAGILPDDIPEFWTQGVEVHLPLCRCTRFAHHEVCDRFRLVPDPMKVWTRDGEQSRFMAQSLVGVIGQSLTVEARRADHENLWLTVLRMEAEISTQLHALRLSHRIAHCGDTNAVNNAAFVVLVGTIESLHLLASGALVHGSGRLDGTGSAAGQEPAKDMAHTLQIVPLAAAEWEGLSFSNGRDRLPAAVYEHQLRPSLDPAHSSRPQSCGHHLKYMLQHMRKDLDDCVPADCTHMLVITQRHREQTVIDLPGGKRELGEAGAATMVRETREETGISLEPLFRSSTGAEWRVPQLGTRAAIRGGDLHLKMAGLIARKERGDLQVRCVIAVRGPGCGDDAPSLKPLPPALFDLVSNWAIKPEGMNVAAETNAVERKRLVLQPRTKPLMQFQPGPGCELAVAGGGSTDDAGGM